MPFAPDIGGWTEDHYTLFGLVELALGNRKELSKGEIEEIEAAKEVDALLESGDPNWLKRIEELMEDGSSLEDLEIDDETFKQIDREQRLRGE